MNTIRCLFLGAIIVISSATFAVGGDIQGPGKSDPTLTRTPTALTAASRSDNLIQPTSTEEIQIGLQDDATTMLVEILLTIF
jgi:hypothetical protein